MFYAWERFHEPKLVRTKHTYPFKMEKRKKKKIKYIPLRNGYLRDWAHRNGIEIKWCTTWICFSCLLNTTQLISVAAILTRIHVIHIQRLPRSTIHLVHVFEYCKTLSSICMSRCINYETNKLHTIIMDLASWK